MMRYIIAFVLLGGILGSTLTAAYFVSQRPAEPDWTYASCETYSTDTPASLPPYTRTDACVAQDGTLTQVK